MSPGGRQAGTCPDGTDPLGGRPSGEGNSGTPTVRRQKIRKNHTRTKLIIFGAIAAAMLICSLFARKLCPYDPYAQDLSAALQAPSLQHPMGMDRYGRDMLSRVIMGSRVSICSTLLLVLVITMFGTIIGVMAGWKGGKPDTVLMRISDIFLAFPGLVFALAVAGVLGGGVQNAIIALAAISWPKYARLARSQTLELKNACFMDAARLSGDSTFTLIRKHILPNIAGPILVTAMLDIGTMMMELAGLSFLGLGAQPPTPEWGSMVSDGRSFLQTAPWMVFAPAVAIFVTVMVFNLLGDTVRDYLDPKARQN